MNQPDPISQLILSSTTATFLSIDVIGSTTLKTGQSEQDIIYSFLSYHKMVSQTVYHAHGHVMNISGDGMMCRFERAADAVQAARIILQDLPLFNKRQNRLAAPFVLRLGVHQGEIMESQAAGTGQLISHTVDVAAKLQQAAPPNTVRLSETVVGLLKSPSIRFEKIGWDTALQIHIYQYSGDSTSPAAKRIPPNPVRILLVDNELDQLMRLKKILWARRHDPFPVFNMDQARLVLTSWKPHLVMVSADLPWNHGWELVRSMRQDEKTAAIPLIAMSHQAKGELIEKYFNAGVNGFLGKPLEEGTIQKRVELVIREFYL